MPTNVGFQIPFIPQEGITQQILAALHFGGQQRFQQQQLGLERQRVQNETQRNQVLNQLTAAQTSKEALDTAYAKETDPIKKAQLLTQLHESNLQYELTKHQAKFFGIDIEGLENSAQQPEPKPGAPGAAAKPVPPAAGEAQPPSPFQQEIQKTKGLLGTMSPDEEAIFDNAAVTSQRTMSATPVTSALAAITTRRAEMARATAGTTPYKAWHDQFVKENGREPNASEILHFTTAGQAIRMQGLENLRQDNYIDTSVPGGAVVAKTAGEFAADNKNEPGRYIKYSGVVQNTLKAQGFINDIRDGMTQMRKAVNDPQFKGLSASGRALMSLAAKNPSSATQTVMSGLAATNLSDTEQNYLIAHATLLERAMSMRQIQGQGAGSDQQRAAIGAMLPSFVTADPKMANKQLDTLENNVANLDRTIPKIGKLEGKTSAGEAAGGKATQPKATHRYNPDTGQIEEIKP